MSQRDRDLDDEIAAHLRMAIEERVARGESRAAAEHAVRAEFGNVTHVKEVTREVARGIWLERLLQDKSLFDVKPTDPTTLAAVTTSIVLVALFAGYLPARRAMRIQALTVLPRD